MQFDGTEHSARAIGAWLGRDTKIVYGILFTVIDADPPTGSLVVHGGRGCWVVRHADDTVTTEAADWINTHNEQVPPAEADAHGLTSRIVEQWQHDHREADDFQIASEEELFGYLLSGSSPAAAHERDSSNVCAAMVKFRSRGARTVA